MTTHTITDKEKKLALFALAIVFLLGALDGTIVGTAMPRIIEQLKGFELYAWVTTSYMLCSTVVVPIYGKLGDIYGRKPILTAGIGLFLIGSVLCGLAGEFGDLPLLGSGMSQLVAFRAIQGLGGAAIFSLSFTIIADLFSARERAKFMGMFGAVFGLASAIGPLIGGFFTDHGTVTIAGVVIAGWRWVFYVNLPLGLFSLFLLITKMPTLPHYGTSKKIDFLGAILFIGASVPLLLVLTWGGRIYAWDSLQIIALSAGGIVSFLLFLWVESVVSDPLLPLSLFRNPVFTMSNLAGFFVGMVFLGILMFVPLFTQIVIGLNATQSGWTQMPMTFGLLIGAIGAGQLARRTGKYKTGMIGGAVMLMGALVWLAGINIGTSPLDMGLRIFVFGFGLGPSQSLFSLAIQNAVPVTQLGIATAASQFFRQMGSVIGVALFGAILTNTLTDELGKRMPELAAMTKRIDLSQVQSQALDPHRMQRELVTQAEGQYAVIARAYENNPNAAQEMLADTSIPDTVKAAVRESAPAATPEALAVVKRVVLAQAESTAARLETGLKESFSTAITHLIMVGFWLMVVSLAFTLFIPSLKLRETSPAEERAKMAAEEAAAREAAT